MLKQLQIKALILYLPFLFASTITFSMLRPPHQKKLQQAQQHQANLQKIKNIQNIEEVNSMVEKINNEVYKECLQELQSKTGFPYDDLKSLIDTKRKDIKESLQQNNFDASHDPNMPEAFYSKTIKALKEDDINPKNIRLTYAHTNDSRHSASSIGPLFFREDPQPEIIFYNAILEMPEFEQDFTRAHELAHIKLRHTPIEYLLKKNDMYKLDSILEREADIHAASKNSYLACAGAEHRCSYGHRDILDEQAHCFQMQFMCELMKRKEELS
jgi:hypothetical protein